MSGVEIGVVVALGVALAGLAALALTGLRSGRRGAVPDAPGPPGPPDPDSDDFRELALERLVSLAATVTGATAAALYGRAEERIGGTAELASTGEAGGLMGIAAVVLRSGRPALVGEGRAAAAVPVMWRGGQDAALVVAADDDRGEFTGTDLELLFEIAGWCGSALDHRSLHGGTLDSTRTQARALETAAAMWDGHEAALGDELATLARGLGEHLGMRGSDLAELALAARLHDVGKLRVPGDVLRRPGPLSRQDWARVRMHPTWSAELVSRVPGLEGVAALISLHHERVDGHGYPHALPAERIPLGARILAVCDAYGALRHERPYRTALSEDEAVAELRGATGQFDPAVVDALEEHLERSPSYA
jgi:HD domain